MPGGLPCVQRQHQPTLRKLRSLRLLHHVGRMLQREVHRIEFRSEKLRCVRICLSRIDANL